MQFQRYASIVFCHGFKTNAATSLCLRTAVVGLEPVRERNEGLKREF